MKPKKIIAPDIDSLIIEVRGQKVILDAALASVYGVETSTKLSNAIFAVFRPISYLSCRLKRRPA